VTDPSLRRYYDQRYHFASDIEAPDLGRIRRMIRLLGPIAEMPFLDIGCGVGWAACVAAEFGVRSTVGIDFSRTALELARGHHEVAAAWVQADGGALPLLDQSFGAVLSFGSIEHLPDVRRGLHEMHRVLRPGGRAVLVVPNFYVRTEQPRELRASYFGWRHLIHDAGFVIEKTAADRGPRVLRDRRLSGIARRLAGKSLSLIPGLQYQFAFVLNPVVAVNGR